MAIRIMNQVWAQQLPPHLKYVAVALADHAHDDGTEARPSQEYLAKKTGLSVRQLRRSLHELNERGLIRVQRQSGRNRPVTWAFTLPDTDDRPSDAIHRSPIPKDRSPMTKTAATSDRLTIRTVIENDEPVADRETAISNIQLARQLMRPRTPTVR